eukprot:CAMPEP_0181182286 /NCGR_PEP_ID=MMETSP1096-20121128/7805_1 /TAXON_ID=156174 ORGANISM="Chrysochromulina ericina, Strain CCMP281" /NCGR_SAMPLE_ID=MMETSP1096 /ASSEMBLY_ACC=CAM_ASM_000453 /LENGTH=110 /DNA_ID=CAMNT_0023270877 /DNA_START=124 /DNA_END=457 /DNA_ORIENTATION=+
MDHAWLLSSILTPRSWTLRGVCGAHRGHGFSGTSREHFADAHNNRADYTQDVDTGLGTQAATDGRGEEHGKPLCEADEQRLVDDEALADDHAQESSSTLPDESKVPNSQA